MKIFNVKVKERTVKYWDFVFLNYKGEQLLYSCVAPTFALACASFHRYMFGCEYTLLSCSTDGKAYALQ